MKQLEGKATKQPSNFEGEEKKKKKKKRKKKCKKTTTTKETEDYSEQSEAGTKGEIDLQARVDELEIQLEKQK